MILQRPTSATDWGTLLPSEIKSKPYYHSIVADERIYKNDLNEAGEYLRRNVDPILADAISYMLIQSVDAKDSPAILLEYFKKIQSNSCQNTMQSFTKQKPKAKRVNRIFIATTIAPLILDLLRNVIGTKPNDVIPFFISILNKQLAIKSKTNKDTNDAANQKSGVDKNWLDMSNLRNQHHEKQLDFKGKEINFIVLGVDGAGKSTLISVLRGSKNPKNRPSLGFRPVSFKYMDQKIKFYDLGGGEKIRGIWKNYFHDVHGIIYVLDCASSIEKYNEAICVGKSTLGHKYLQGKPTLVICNKIDQTHGRSLSIIQTDMNLLINQFGHNRIVHASLHPQKADPASKLEPFCDALNWLINKTMIHYDDLQERVISDSKERQKIEKEEQVQRERRVMRNCICKSLSPASENDPNIFTPEDGIEFLAHEVGLEGPDDLPQEGKRVAELVGYQKLALMLIGGMICPVGKKKEPWTWEKTVAYVKSIRLEVSN